MAQRRDARGAHGGQHARGRALSVDPHLVAQDFFRGQRIPFIEQWQGRTRPLLMEPVLNVENVSSPPAVPKRVVDEATQTDSEGYAAHVAASAATQTGSIMSFDSSADDSFVSSRPASKYMWTDHAVYTILFDKTPAGLRQFQQQFQQQQQQQRDTESPGHGQEPFVLRAAAPDPRAARGGLDAFMDTTATADSDLSSFSGPATGVRGARTRDAAVSPSPGNLLSPSMLTSQPAAAFGVHGDVASPFGPLTPLAGVDAGFGR
nr:hypothetical protein HK105_006201 [Polyrhizophydium stewartii]